MSFAAQRIRDARNHLRRSGEPMREVIRVVGPFTARIRRDRFAALAGAIVGQQISGKAAQTIWNRLQERLGGRVAPESLRQFSIDQLRQVGVSRQKATCLLDLAGAVERGDLVLSTIGRKPDEAVVAELTQVRGVGRWTAHMFLMFCLGRLDVLPVDDQGIRTAMRNLHDLCELPGAREMEELATPWRPYATVASWYLWQWLDQ